MQSMQIKLAHVPGLEISFPVKEIFALICLC